MVRSFTEQEIIEYLKIPLERRIELLDETYDFIMSTMGPESRKAFEYLRNLNVYNSDKEEYER